MASIVPPIGPCPYVHKAACSFQTEEGHNKKYSHGKEIKKKEMPALLLGASQDGRSLKLVDFSNLDLSKHTRSTADKTTHVALIFLSVVLAGLGIAILKRVGSFSSLPAEKAFMWGRATLAGGVTLLAISLYSEWKEGKKENKIFTDEVLGWLKTKNDTRVNKKSVLEGLSGHSKGKEGLVRVGQVKDNPTQGLYIYFSCKGQVLDHVLHEYEASYIREHVMKTKEDEALLSICPQGSTCQLEADQSHTDSFWHGKKHNS